MAKMSKIYFVTPVVFLRLSLGYTERAILRMLNENIIVESRNFKPDPNDYRIVPGYGSGTWLCSLLYMKKR